MKKYAFVIIYIILIMALGINGVLSWLMADTVGPLFLGTVISVFLAMKIVQDVLDIKSNEK